MMGKLYFLCSVVASDVNLYRTVLSRCRILKRKKPCDLELLFDLLKKNKLKATKGFLLCPGFSGCSYLGTWGNLVVGRIVHSVYRVALDRHLRGPDVWRCRT